MQATPPAAMAAPPPASTVKGASATLTIAYDDLQLTLSKARRAESATVRYQLFLKLDVDRKLPDGADQRSIQCGWRVRAFLQRTICVSSMTGLLGCVDPETEEMAEAETGAADQGLDPAASACDLNFAPAREARDRMSANLKASAAARFEGDYRLKVEPLLLASGVKIKRLKS
jgi:hypothetical protein